MLFMRRFVGRHPSHLWGRLYAAMMGIPPNCHSREGGNKGGSRNLRYYNAKETIECRRTKPCYQSSKKRQNVIRTTNP
jgi:hypothetical protein